MRPRGNVHQVGEQSRRSERTPIFGRSLFSLPSRSTRRKSCADLPRDEPFLSETAVPIDTGAKSEPTHPALLPVPCMVWLVALSPEPLPDVRCPLDGWGTPSKRVDLSSRGVGPRISGACRLPAPGDGGPLNSFIIALAYLRHSLFLPR